MVRGVGFVLFRPQYHRADPDGIGAKTQQVVIMTTGSSSVD